MSIGNRYQESQPEIASGNSSCMGEASSYRAEPFRVAVPSLNGITVSHTAL